METKKEIIVKFYGIDNFNRPIFKVIDKKCFFGSVDILFTDEREFLEKKEDFKKMLTNNNTQLCYFGKKFNCEPEGIYNDRWKFKIL